MYPIHVQLWCASHRVTLCRLLHSEEPSCICEVRRGMAGFGGAALGSTLVAMDLVVVCLLVGYFNSTAVQTGSRTVLAVEMDVVGV